jgi:hypothetical protein
MSAYFTYEAPCMIAIYHLLQAHTRTNYTVSFRSSDADQENRYEITHAQPDSSLAKATSVSLV